MKWTEAAVFSVLDRALGGTAEARERAFLRRVKRATGFHEREADAVSCSLWASRGIEFEGYEIKVSRSDWKRELANPEKADGMVLMCHRWWIVAPEGIVPAAEVPETWGLLEVVGEGELRTAVKAPKRVDAKPDWPLVASLMRKANETVRQALADDESYARGVLAGRAEWESRKAELEHSMERANERDKRDAEHWRKEHEALALRVLEFQRDSGIFIDRGTDVAEVARAVKFVLDGGLRGEAEEFRRIAATAEKTADRFRAIASIAESLPAPAENPPDQGSQP